MISKLRRRKRSLNFQQRKSKGKKKYVKKEVCLLYFFLLYLFSNVSKRIRYIEMWLGNRDVTDMNASSENGRRGKGKTPKKKRRKKSDSCLF
jgi:hypothetical protein